MNFNSRGNVITQKCMKILFLVVNKDFDFLKR